MNKCKTLSRLNDYFTNLDETITTQHDYFMALVVTIFWECGFYIQDASGNNSKYEYTPPCAWSSRDGIYDIKLVLHEIPHVIFKLIATISADRMILNFFPVTKDKRIYSLAVRITRYMNPFAASFGDRYMYQEELSTKMKTELVYKARSDALTEAGIVNGSFLGLPTELKLKILGYLRPRDIMRLSQCCHEFNMLCKDESVWRKFFKDECNNSSDPYPESCYLAYRDSYLSYKKTPGFRMYKDRCCYKHVRSRRAV